MLCAFSEAFLTGIFTLVFVRAWEVHEVENDLVSIDIEDRKSKEHDGLVGTKATSTAQCFVIVYDLWLNTISVRCPLVTQL